MSRRDRQTMAGIDDSAGKEDAPVQVRPGRQEIPIVFDSPHSGRVYPADFGAAVSQELLQHYEDRFVDRLLDEAVSHGVAVVSAHFSRAYIDPNRAPDDLDPVLIETEATGEELTPHSKRGTGLIFRVLADNSPIYDRTIDVEEATRRLNDYWRPYHRALQEQLESAHEAHGAVWHINWHSMRPVGDENSPDPGKERADFILGDLGGASCDPEFTSFMAEKLQMLGYSVAINDPYQGAYIVKTYGRPAKGWHSLQIEINRALYMDMATLTKTAQFEQIKTDIGRLTEAAINWVGEHSH